jgi:hypothetical protein
MTTQVDLVNRPKGLQGKVKLRQVNILKAGKSRSVHKLLRQHMSPAVPHPYQELIPGNRHQRESAEPILNKTLTPNAPPKPPQPGKKNG